MSRYYLYAIGPGGANLPNELTGIQGAPVFTVSVPGLTAFVSELSTEKVRPERRNLMAHQQVLRALMTELTPLPMSFGTVAADAERTERLLLRHEEDFQQQLQRVNRAVEMGLRVSWDVPNIFEYFVIRHAPLGQLRDEIRQQESAMGAARPQARLELGRLFEQLREEERSAIDSQVSQGLSRVVREIHRGACRNETDILQLSCLIDRSAQEAFAATVVEIASRFDSNFAFDYNGPWAPHHFVNLEIDAPEN